MTFSNAGLAGALIGLGFGLIEYVLALRIIGRMLSREAGAEQPEQAGVDRVQALMRPIRYALLAAAFIVYPVVGYLVGASFASEGK
jgi:cytochrome b561